MNALPRARRILRSLCLLSIHLALCAFLSQGVALAQSAYGRPVSTEMTRIEEMMAEAEFETALSMVNDALARPGRTEAERAQLYELQGMLHLYLGDEDAARQSFRQLLTGSPQYRLRDDASPKVMTIFEEARDEMAAELSRQLKLSHPRPRSARPGVPIQVELKLESAPEGVQAKLFYRRTAVSGFSSTLFVESEDKTRWVAHVPDLDLELNETERLPSGALEYFIEVQDPTGSLLAIAGKREAPLVVPMATAAELAAEEAAGAQIGESAWYQKWWVWTIVGVVVAGAVTGGVIYALSDQTGTVPVTVTLR